MHREKDASEKIRRAVPIRRIMAIRMIIGSDSQCRYSTLNSYHTRAAASMKNRQRPMGAAPARWGAYTSVCSFSLRNLICFFRVLSFLSPFSTVPTDR